MTGAIAAQLVLSLRRQRTFLALLVTLLVMTALAGVIGWISHRTIIKVYDEAVTLLATTGTPAPPNPFDTKPTLALLSNMVIYIPLIGALMALVLGHLSMADDQSSGIGRLIFSRQVTRRSYVTGKMLGATTVLAIIMAASLLVSAVSLLIVNGAVLSAPDLDPAGGVLPPVAAVSHGLCPRGHGLSAADATPVDGAALGIGCLARTHLRPPTVHLRTAPHGVAQPHHRPGQHKSDLLRCHSEGAPHLGERAVQGGQHPCS